VKEASRVEKIGVIEWVTVSNVILKSTIDMKRVPGNPMISSNPKAVEEMRKIVNEDFDWSEARKDEKKLYELESEISWKVFVDNKPYTEDEFNEKYEEEMKLERDNSEGAEKGVMYLRFLDGYKAPDEKHKTPKKFEVLVMRDHKIYVSKFNICDEQTLDSKFLFPAGLHS